MLHTTHQTIYVISVSKSVVKPSGKFNYSTADMYSILRSSRPVGLLCINSKSSTALKLLCCSSTVKPHQST